MKSVFLWTFINLLGACAFNPDHIGDKTPPYLVYLMSDYLPCTGVLINPLWVITAAHCNLPKLRVMLGVTNPSDFKEANVEVVGYEKMIQHPYYSTSSIDYDLMLIKLKRTINPSKYVKVVELPQFIISENTMCSVSTWAYNLCDRTKDPDSLQTVNISVITKPECNEAYKAYGIKENMICVGIVPGRRMPCKEVSAAPAVCDGMLYGILSYTDGCVLRADVGIYASIFHYMTWIENTINNN